MLKLDRVCGVEETIWKKKKKNAKLNKYHCFRLLSVGHFDVWYQRDKLKSLPHLYCSFLLILTNFCKVDDLFLATEKNYFLD